MITVLNIFGTRPEAVKMSPVILELQKYPQQIRTVVCNTGQHREMVQHVLDLFAIEPDFQLDMMQPDQTLTGSLVRILSALDEVVQQSQPDWIIAQGDTTTVLAAAITAYYNRRRFAHLEAGLRTDDKYRPYPEEGNRLMADAIADVYFAPTTTARERLLRENIPAEKIYVTGNTVVDALLKIAKQPYNSPSLDWLPDNKRIILVTAHRRESFGEAFQNLCYALRDIALEYDDALLVYPVHLNPNVQKPVYDILSNVDNIKLIDPLPYADLVHLMKRASLILTDSGGIQEEAPTFNVPLLVMRDTTERPEGIAAGVAHLVGTDRERIVTLARTMLNRSHTDRKQIENPYGDGQASRRIAEFLLNQTKE